MTQAFCSAPGTARAAAAFALAAALFAAAPARSHAQFTNVPAPAVYAIRNATVVQPDGSRVTGANVVVRGSFIEAIGRDAAIPAGAQVLEGDSLFVYPGLIDAMGSVKFEFPKDSVNLAAVKSWDPPRSVQGFMPSRRVADFIRPGATEVADLRKKGVVAIALHPSVDLIMPGQGTLLMLRNAPGDPRRMVITPSLGAVMTMRPARGAYPGTGMGLIAFYRQTFIDAQRNAEIARRAATDPRVLAPSFDADYAAVQQALSGAMPTWFVANTAEEIITALRLSDEFKLKPTIVGGQEAWKVAAELKARNVPVLASLNFPKPRQWKPETKADSARRPGERVPGDPPAGDRPAADTASVPADSAKAKSPAELVPGALREKQRIEESYANAAQLARAGVRFALTSGGGEADLREGVRKAMEFGLSETDALRALTATPAQLLGLPGLGSVKIGMPATFVVTQKPIFQKDGKVMYTFVEGELEKGGAK